MTREQRYKQPVDVHLILRRETPAGPEILLSRRAGDVYTAGLWHLPSGHTEDGEDIREALIREAREETGVLIDPADVSFAVAVHHRAPSGTAARVGFFFEVLNWQGAPRILEPAVCDGMAWFRLEHLVSPMVAYCRAGLDAYRSGRHLALHFQDPDDLIPYAADADRSDPVPTARAIPLQSGGPDVRVRAMAGQAAGRIAEPRTARVLLPPEEYASSVPKSTGSAFIFFTDRDNRPVQLRATYSQAHPWQFPGGTMDHGERPWETAQRECREETGLDVAGPPRLLASVFGPPGGGWPFSTTGCVFDGGRLSDAQIRSIVLDPDEHDALRVLTLKEWEPLMPSQDFARLEAVMTARLTGTTAYFDSWGWGNG